MNHKQNIWNNMARFLSGEMDDHEKTGFLNLLESDAFLNSQFQKMKNTWTSFDNKPTMKYKDTGKAWEKLKGNLEKDGLLEGSREKVNIFYLRPAVRIAATVLIILGIGIPTVFLSVTGDKKNATEISHLAKSGVNTVDLPDGSRVYMNKGAEISYPAVFDKGRTLKLHGEAFFEVMADPENPFTVHSGKITVSVLGTSFNVKENEKGNGVEVFVESGLVKVTDDQNNKNIVLHPGELGVADRDMLTMGSNENPNYLSWKTKEFIFVNEEVDQIFKTLESAYHVEIVTGNLDTASMRLTSTYNQQSIDAILETISAAFNLELKKEGDIYYLN